MLSSAGEELPAATGALDADERAEDVDDAGDHPERAQDHGQHQHRLERVAQDQQADDQRETAGEPDEGPPAVAALARERLHDPETPATTSWIASSTAKTASETSGQTTSTMPRPSVTSP